MTSLDRITHNDNKVSITLHARSASKYSSLERTALKHFDNWQQTNYARLGYKSSTILESTSKPDPNDDTHYFYTLVIGLMYPKSPKPAPVETLLPSAKLLEFSSPAGNHRALLKPERSGRYDYTANVYRGSELFFEGDRLFSNPDDAMYEIELDFYDYVSDYMTN